jgi:thiol-disulfide isomerase/thioredoxin
MIALPTLALFAVLASPGQPLLLDFHADWCGPCRSMEPTVRRLVADGYAVRQVNIDREQNLARQFQVDRVPTYVMVVGGREVGRVVGPTSYDSLTNMFAAAKAAGPPVAEAPAAPAAPALTATAATISVPGPDPKALAVQATVRIRVEDNTGNSFGTGTVIDAHGEEALVMTCAHLFRESQGQGKIVVDLFAPGATGPVAGQLISYDLKHDVALVAIRPGVSITPVPLAPGGYAIRLADRVFSIGCDQGGAPSLRDSQITALNKYQGPANIEAAGQPVIGRSGGGLFSADGQLIGVCNLADPKDNEGIYAALSLLHENLDKIGQSRIYQRQAPQLAAAQPPAAAVPATSGVSPPLPDMPREMPRTPLAGAELQPVAGVRPAASAPPITPLLSQPSGDMEVICIVRSKSDPRGPSEVIYLDRPSVSLLEQLAMESRSDSRREPAVLQASRSPPGQPPTRFDASGSVPVIRAQTD